MQKDGYSYTYELYNEREKNTDNVTKTDGK